MMRSLNDPLDVDSRRIDAVRIQTAGLDQFLYFCDRYVSRGGHHWIEVSCGSPVNQIAQRVSPPGLNQCELRAQWQFQDVVPSIPGSRFLVFCRDGTVPGRSVKAADSRAARPNAFRQGSLGAQLDLQFPIPHQLFKGSVFADIARDHLLHLLIAQEEPNAEILGAGVVADHRQISNPLITQRLN